MKKWFFIGIIALGALAMFVPSPTPSAAQGSLQQLNLLATDVVAANGLQAETATAVVDVPNGYLWVTLEAVNLPQGAVLEAWLVDQDSASTDDEAFGVTFGNETLAEALNGSPFAQSVGILAPTSDGSFQVIYQLTNSNFSAYDDVVLTLESNSVSPNFDPRPAAIAYTGRLQDATPTEITTLPAPAAEYLDGIGLTLSNTGAAAPLAALNGQAELYAGSGTVRVTVNTNDAALPPGTVLEAWLWEAGLETGGPGISNVSDADEAFGVFLNDTVNTNLARTFHPLSLGTLADNGDSTFSLESTLQGYHFGPYDALIITHEADGNSPEGYDPRPGSAILLATVEQGVPLDATVTAFDGPSWASIPLRNARTGEVFTLADLAGEGLTVHVEPMATWCSNCLRQQQNVREVFNSTDPNTAVFISLSVQSNLTDDTLVRYAANQDFNWTFAIASEELLQELVDEFGRSITNPPSTPSFVLFPDGSHTELKTGYASPAEIREFAQIN